MTQGLCFRNKFAFCKFRENCTFRHINKKCREKTCNVYNCEKRRHKICKHFRVYRCKFTAYCKFENQKHVHIAENSDTIYKLETKMDNMKVPKSFEKE